MKEGWHIETISSLCEQMNGIWKGEKEPLTTAKILRTTNFSKDCQMKLDDLAIIEVEQKKMEKRRLKRGDIIVEKSGGGPKQPVGRVILFNIDDDDFSFCNFTSALRIKDQTKILPEFLHKYLTYLYFSGETEKYQSNLVGFRNLDFKGYVSICVKYPSLSEQQRIVALLDAEFAKIDALKANAEKNLQNAKDLFQAALNKLIIGGSKGWKSTKLKTICSKIGSGATPLGGKSTYGKEGVSLIRSLNVHNNEFHYEDLAHINEEQAKQLSNVEIKEDDVLFNITGASVTRCCKVPKDVLPARVNQHVSILRLLPDTLLPNFLVYTMISPHHNTALMKMAENGATRQAITKKQLEEWVIEYPETIADQQSIVARLDVLNEKCKTLQANYEKTLSLCDDLKQALLRKAFNGEI